MGPCRLTRLDIRLWEADEAQRLEYWERRALIDIDNLWIGSMAEQMAPASSPGAD